MSVPRIFRCPVERCAHKFYDWSGPNSYYERHLEERHVICRCGWVGIDYGKHLGQRRRHAAPTAWCRVMAYVWTTHSDGTLRHD